MTDSNSLRLWREKQNKIEQQEDLLNIENKRDSLYPIRYPKMWEFYNIHSASHWVPQEIDLSKDVNDWASLTKDEQFYIKYALAFFSTSDFIINESQAKDDQEVQILEYKFFNTDKMARENIHSITYADLLETYVTDEKEKDYLKNAITNIDAIKKKGNWMYEYIQNGTFVERIVAEAIMEGIFFSGSFCSIFWLKKRGLMSALCDANEFIARDEGLHRDFNCYIYRDLIKNKLPEDVLIDMIKKAVKIEQVFVSESLPVRLIGMNNELMCKYIEYIADHLCYNLIYKKIYNVENPFSDWMSAISLKTKADFFVHRPTAYSKASSMNKEDIQIRYNEDF